MSIKKLIPANSVARALTQVGDRWSLLILGAAFCGMRRFDEWRKGIGIASNILTNRLARLTRIGCFEKLPANEGGRQIYHLTEMGRELFPTALMFWRFDRLWSQRHPLQPNTLLHMSCGQATVPTIICRHCRSGVVARDVRYADGPGAGMERLPPPKSSRRSSITLDDGAVAPMLFGDSIDLFGDRWTQLVLASFFLGERRYKEIQARWHISTNVLADRLHLLVENGMLQRRIYQTNPERSEYVLTPKGMDVYPIILMLTKWGDHWLAPKGARPLLLTHTRCGAELDPLVVCNCCDVELDPHEINFRTKTQEALTLAL
ncbi:MAG: helix-turn-helix transcriptional regulator [Zoogloeaceae bacterium]|jgi:DNA-binding HxlR family transcriptional regulator|nr:helix-turn-helix transcriptional regulator [Zoogloeaceae bacterium]